MFFQSCSNDNKGRFDMQSFTRNSMKTCGSVSNQVPDEQLLIIIFFPRSDTDNGDTIIRLLTGSRDQQVL